MPDFDFSDTREIVDRRDELVRELDRQVEIADEIRLGTTRDLSSERIDPEDIEEMTEEKDELEDIIREIGEPNAAEGRTLVLEEDFTDYAQEYARDIGAISGEEQWPLDYIDWEGASRALAEDFSEVTISGYTYLYRTY